MDHQSHFVSKGPLSSSATSDSTIPPQGPSLSTLKCSPSLTSDEIVAPRVNNAHHRMSSYVLKLKAEREVEANRQLQEQSLETGMQTASNLVDPRSCMSDIPAQEYGKIWDDAPSQSQRAGISRASITSSPDTLASDIQNPWDVLTIDDAPDLQIVMGIMELDYSGERLLGSYGIFYDSDATEDDPQWGPNGYRHQPKINIVVQVSNNSNATIPMSSNDILRAASKRARVKLTTDLLNTDPVLGKRRKREPIPKPTRQPAKRAAKQPVKKPATKQLHRSNTKKGSER